MGGALVAILFLVLGGGFGLGIWWLFRPNPTDPFLNASDTVDSTSNSTDSAGSGDSGSGGGDGGD